MPSPPTTVTLTFTQMLIAAAIGSIVTMLSSLGIEALKGHREKKSAFREFQKEELRSKRDHVQELIAALYEGQNTMFDCSSWKSAVNEYSLRDQKEADPTRTAENAERWKDANASFEASRSKLESITLTWLVLAEKASPSADGNENLIEEANRVRNDALWAASPPQMFRAQDMTANDVALKRISPLIKICRVHVQNYRVALEATVKDRKPSFAEVPSLKD